MANPRISDPTCLEARKRLKAAVTQVAAKHVVEPVESEVVRLKAFNAAVKAAGR